MADKIESMKKEHLLILEINEKNYKVLQNLFEKNSYETTAVLDKEAFAKVIQTDDEYDAIIVNAHIKFADSQAIQTLTKNGSTREFIPIIYIDSAKVHDKEMLEKSFASGAADYIKKPFDSKEILVRVKYHINTSKKLREYKLRIDKLANLATIDQLSKSTSKMHMQAILRHELNNYKRYGTEDVSIIYLGITSIEKHISAFGLEKGEKIIAQFAKFLRANIRESDVLARWVGSEFIILLTNTTIKTTESVIRKLKILLAADETLAKSQLELAFGVTAIKKDDTNEELLSRVQYAYKAAKKQTYGKLEVIA
jgi:diguanylate cyclase (GGDEF)-like protein